MKILTAVILFLSLYVNAQDTLLLTEQITYDQDSNITKRWTRKLNKYGLITYAEAINYKRKDTAKTRYFYDSQKRITMYIVNGPYFPDHYDTTRYEYDRDTTLIIQRGNGYERITKNDKQDRRFYFSSKHFDEDGILYLLEVDSIYYDDIANTRTSRAYRMENYPPPKPTKQTERIHIDGNWIDIETNDLAPVIIDKKKKKPGLELRGTGYVQYNDAGLSTHSVTSFPGNNLESFTTYDSLDRLIKHELIYKDEDSVRITTFTYEISGDTLIRYQKRSEKPEDISITKESLIKKDGQPLWQLGFYNGKPSGKYFRVYDNSGYLIETSHWRPKKDTEKLEWTIDRTVYKYESFPIIE